MQKMNTKSAQAQQKALNSTVENLLSDSSPYQPAEEDGELECGGMSLTEKRILASIIAPEPPLPYPLRLLPMRFGPAAREYVIPEQEKEKVLKQTYPFFPCPSLHEMRYDLHEEKCFQVGDFKVIRENGRNFLVSPFYARSGGMVIDWMDEQNPGSQILVTEK